MGPAPYPWSCHKSIKLVDHGTVSYFRYIQKPEQDFMILINLSPQILVLLRLYFPLSPEKVMVERGSVRSSFVTLLSALCAFSHGNERGIPCCKSSLTHKSNRKAMNRNWRNQKSNPALKTKAGNK